MPRGEFISLILKRAALTGAVLSAPRILDKFLIPPVWAYGSSCTTADTASQNDIVVFNGGSTITPTDNDDSYVSLAHPGESTYCVVSLGTGHPVNNY